MRPAPALLLLVALAAQGADQQHGSGSPPPAEAPPAKASPADRLANEAMARLRMGDPGGAKAAAERALQLDPRNRQAHIARAAAYLRLGSPAESAQATDEGLRAAPGEALLLLTRAHALNRMGRHRLALDAVEQALAQEPRNPEALMLKAWALAGLGAGRETVLKTLAEAARLDPRFQELYDRAALLDSGLAALFGGEASGPGEARPAAARKERSLLVAAAALAGGLLLALGCVVALRSRPADGSEEDPPLDEGLN